MKLDKNKTLCVDFDGTIASKNTYDPQTINATPNEGVHDALKTLADTYTVIIYTTRLSPSQNHDSTQFMINRNMLKSWLDKNGFIQGTHYHDMLGVKIPAKHYIDDHGYHYTHWNQTIKDLHGLRHAKTTA